MSSMVMISKPNDLHNIEISTRATQLSMTPLLIIRWDHTCFNRSNTVLIRMPWLKALVSTKAHLVTHMILSNGNKNIKKPF